MLNVDDSMVSLNPDNIIFVHFRCHNEIHKRFGFGGKPHGVVKQVYLVYGAPYAGKHTWVDGVADDSDIIVSYDRLWQSIRHGNGKPRALTDNVFGLYDCLIDMVKVRRGRWHSAYIIGGFPSSGQRERLVLINQCSLIHRWKHAWFVQKRLVQKHSISKIGLKNTPPYPAEKMPKGDCIGNT